MRPVEIKLLLTCARTKLDERLEASLSSLCKKQVNWEKAIQLSLTHRVMPLLFINLEKARNHCAPLFILNKLRTFYYTNLQHSLAISGELAQLVTLFQNNEIDFIPVKGPALAEAVYGDLALRQYADLDILVNRKDSAFVYQMLLNNGYRPEIKLDAGQLAAYSKTEYSIGLYHAETKVTVELHWNLTGRYTTYPFDMGGLDGSVDSVAFEGLHIRQLSTEDLLVYLCIHGSKDGWCVLDSICCVAELIRSCRDIDWIRVFDRADQMRCRRMVFVGLYLAYSMLAAPIKEKVMNIIATDPVVINVALKIERSLFDYPLVPKERQIPSDFSFIHFTIRENVSDKLHYLFNLLFIPTRRDWYSITLPARLAFLYYPLRPLRLAGEMMLLLFRNLKSKAMVPQIKPIR